MVFTFFTLHLSNESYLNMVQDSSWAFTRPKLLWDLTAVQLENKKSPYANSNQTTSSLLEDCLCVWRIIDIEYIQSYIQCSGSHSVLIELMNLSPCIFTFKSRTTESKICKDKCLCEATFTLIRLLCNNISQLRLCRT